MVICFVKILVIRVCSLLYQFFSTNLVIRNLMTYQYFLASGEVRDNEFNNTESNDLPVFYR